jgi:F0F1-type ATP synthase epsilon subunit
MVKCTVVSPLSRKVVEGLEGIFLKTVTGEVGILTGHMPIVAQVRDGSVARLKTAAGEIQVKLGAASFFQFKNNEGILLTREYSVEGEAGPAA